MNKTLAVRLDELGTLDWSRVKSMWRRAQIAKQKDLGYSQEAIKKHVERWNDSQILRAILSKLAWQSSNVPWLTPAK